MLKFICKVLFVAISCTHFALAYEMSMERFLEQQQNAEEEWLEWLVIKSSSHIRGFRECKERI